MEKVRVLVRRLTVVLLVASIVLLMPGLAGLGGSILLTIALAGGGLALVSARSEFDDLPTVFGYDLNRYARDLWLSLFLAAALLVAVPDASSGELQSLGGFAGFAGMLNYFLTPVYLFAYSLLRRLGSNQSQTSREQL
jgi:hypothetical protein